MTPEVMRSTQPEIIIQDEQQQRLFQQAEKTLRQEGFERTPLEEKIESFFTSDNNAGVRCVDGRGRLLKFSDGTPIEYTGTYLGPQLPGGVNSIIGVTRLLTSVVENEAQELTLRALQGLGIKPGNHIDDAHGTIQTQEELETRTSGCGNQDQIAKGGLPMYKGTVTASDVISRVKWLRDIGGSLPVLTGDHQERAATLNLVSETTFNTQKAVTDGSSIFNADLPIIPSFAKAVFDQLPTQRQKGRSRGLFADQMVEEVVRDYAQTLIALNGPRTMQIRWSK